jgi:two-component system, chemotaxis family, protein-glutamate methylesterase/glutaminase
MPEAALATCEPDAVVPASLVAETLVAWTHEEVEDAVPPRAPRRLRYEAGIAVLGPQETHGESPGHPSTLTCPECSGVLWEVTEGGVD